MSTHATLGPWGSVQRNAYTPNGRDTLLPYAKIPAILLSDVSVVPPLVAVLALEMVTVTWRAPSSCAYLSWTSGVGGTVEFGLCMAQNETVDKVVWRIVGCHRRYIQLDSEIHIRTWSNVPWE